VRGKFSLRKSLLELWRRRDLIAIMTVSQIRARYKQSLLGFAWAVLQPLILMFLFTFIFSKMLHVTSEGLPYPLFSYSALIFFSFFSTCLTLGVPSLVIYAPIIRKIYFPREIFPLVTVLASVFDLIFAALVFLLLLIIYPQAGLTWTALWVLPLLIIQTLFTLGVVFFAAAVCAMLRDVQWGIPLITQVWLYCTPVIYSLDAVPPQYRWILLLNPLTGLVDGYRKALLHNAAPDMLYLGISLVFSVAAFYLGYRYFKAKEMTFADIL